MKTSDEEDEQEEFLSTSFQPSAKSLEAWKSMKFCSKAVFFAFFVDVALIVSTDSWGNMFQTYDSIRPILVTLYRILLGSRLWQVSQIYYKVISNPERPSWDMLYKAAQVLSRLWFQTAILLVVVSVLLSTNIAQLTENAMWLTVGPLSALASAFGGGTILYLLSRTAENEISKDNPVVVANDMKTKKSVGATQAREMGFSTARNLSFCMGAYILLAAMQFTTTIVNPETRIIAKAWGSYSDISGALVMAKLIGALSANFRLAIATATSIPRSSGGDRSMTDETIAGLYDAQKGFYSKVGKTQATQAIVKTIPSLVSLLKSVF